MTRLGLGEEAWDAEREDTVPVGGGVAQIGLREEAPLLPGRRRASAFLRKVARGRSGGALSLDAGDFAGAVAFVEVLALDDPREGVGLAHGKAGVGEGEGEHPGPRDGERRAGRLALFANAPDSGVDVGDRQSVNELGLVERSLKKR